MSKSTISTFQLFEMFPTPESAKPYLQQPEALMNYVYANALGNGDVNTRDGMIYRGGGVIQITGRANYKICGDALGVDFESEPVLLESSRYAALSAAWYWEKHGCNELADANEFITITRRINGGLNGQEQRVALLEQATSIIV